MVSLDFLRPLKAQYMEYCYNIFESGSHALQYDIIESATIVVPSENSRIAPVVLEDGTIHPYSYEDDDLPSVVNKKDIKTEYYNQTVLYGGYLDPHWGHFLMDSLSRLWPIFYSGIKVDKIVFASHYNSIDAYTPNIRESLRLAGIIDKVELITERRRFSQLIVPQRSISPRHFACQETNTVYDAIIKQAIKENRNEENINRRIYLSRSKFPKARANEPHTEWIDHYFADNGFEIIYPEKLTLVDMITKIQESEIVVALSGTLPHSMVFGRYGTKTWIIEKTPAVNNYQHGVDILRKLDVTYVDASALVWTTSAGLGPFIVFPNNLFCRFAESKGLKKPIQWNDKEKRKVLSKFIKMYHRHYSRQWVLAEWEEEEISLLREAWRETMNDFGLWITGEKPITIVDSFSPRAILKRLYHRLRNFIKKINY